MNAKRTMLVYRLIIGERVDRCVAIRMNISIALRALLIAALMVRGCVNLVTVYRRVISRAKFVHKYVQALPELYVKTPTNFVSCQPVDVAAISRVFVLRFQMLVLKSTLRFVVATG